MFKWLSIHKPINLSIYLSISLILFQITSVDLKISFSSLFQKYVNFWEMQRTKVDKIEQEWSIKAKLKESDDTWGDWERDW